MPHTAQSDDIKDSGPTDSALIHVRKRVVSLDSVWQNFGKKISIRNVFKPEKQNKIASFWQWLILSSHSENMQKLRKITFSTAVCCGLTAVL